MSSVFSGEPHSFSPSESVSTSLSNSCTPPLSVQSDRSFGKAEMDDVWGLMNGGDEARQERLDEIAKAVDSLSSCDLAVLFDVLALHSRYQSAAVISVNEYEKAVDGYEKAGILFEDAKIRWLRTKEHKERCVEEYTKFKTYAEKLMSSSARFARSQFTAARGQQGFTGTDVSDI